MQSQSGPLVLLTSALNTDSKDYQADIPCMIQIKNLYKSYEKGKVKALNNLSMSISPGEIIALMGPSGCGKSTLLNIIGALDAPDSGQLLIANKPIVQYRPYNKYRSTMVGFIFQFHHLIPSLTLLENVELPMYTGKKYSSGRERMAKKMLYETGLRHRINSYPNNISGGERQRTAIARSLVNDPKIILADEPTGSIDSQTGEKVISFLIEQCRNKEITLIMATHNPVISEMAQKIFHMRDGQIH